MGEKLGMIGLGKMGLALARTRRTALSSRW